MNFEDYCAIDRMNASTLVYGFRQIGGTMRKLKAAIDGSADEPTPAKSFGNKYHAVILEPDTFAKQYRVMPNYAADEANVDSKGKRSSSWATKYCKDHKEAFFAELKESGAKHIKADEVNQCLAIQKAVMMNDEAFRIIAKSQREVTLLGEIDGIQFKCRLDLLSNDEISDLKGTNTVAEKPFGSQAARLGYGFKLAIYREIARQNTGKTLPVSMIAVETVGVHDCVVYDVPEPVLDEGLEFVRETIAEMKQCKESGFWPGHDRGQGRVLLYWPNWAMRDDPVLEWGE